MLASYTKSLRAAFLAVFCLGLGLSAYAQSGSATSVTGTVVDPSGAVVPKAIVELHNPVSGFDRTMTTDAAGRFTFPNVSFNPYHLTVTLQGFAPYAQDIDVRSVVPVSLNISLTVSSSTESVTVEAAAEDLLENTSTFHTDVDRDLFTKLPIEKPVVSFEFSRHPGNSRCRC
jgi:Carboxypeptidase regulatory-like domain